MSRKNWEQSVWMLHGCRSEYAPLWKDMCNSFNTELLRVLSQKYVIELPPLLQDAVSKKRKLWECRRAMLTVTRVTRAMKIVTSRVTRLMSKLIRVSRLPKI